MRDGEDCDDAHYLMYYSNNNPCFRITYIRIILYNTYPLPTLQHRNELIHTKKASKHNVPLWYLKGCVFHIVSIQLHTLKYTVYKFVRKKCLWLGNKWEKLCSVLSWFVNSEEIIWFCKLFDWYYVYYFTIL